MKRRKSAFEAASPWLNAMYLILSTWLGWSLISSLISMDGGSLHTIRLLISLAVAGMIQAAVSYYGVLICGWLCGKKLLMIRKGDKAKVKEGDRFFDREQSFETTLSPFVMASKGEMNDSFFLMGGVIGNLAIVLISVLLLITGLIRASSNVGSLFLSLIMTGLWAIAVNGLPSYRGKEPNACLKVIMLLTDTKASVAYDQNMQFIYELSSGHLENAGQIDYPDLEEDEDDEPMSLFRASYLLRVYEVLVWAGKWEDASVILAQLYYHVSDFPDDWQDRLTQEVIFLMNKMGNPEEVTLSDELLSPVKKQRFLQEKSFESYKALFFWALSSNEGSLEDYFNGMKEAAKSIPFKGARQAWIRIVQES